MPENRFRWVIYTQIGWMAITLLALIAWELFTPEIFFTISFIELLVVRQLFVPTDTEQRWWVLLRWLTAFGFVVFGAIVFQRISEFLF